MATFNFNSQREQGATDPGAGFKWMVRICGLIAIGGFFLPYINKQSGFDFVNLIIDTGAIMGYGDFWSQLFEADTTLGSVVNAIILIAYFIFPLIGLMMLIRGKYSGGPFTLLLLFNIGAWAMINFFGPQAGIEHSFFFLTGMGYWISCAGVFLPFVGMFFLDKSI